MKHIKKFNETKKEDKVEDQEVLFNAEVLVDKDEKPSFTTDVEDQEKIKKEFDKLIKVKNFENFTIEIEVKKTEDSEEQTLLGGPESTHTLHDNNMRNMYSEEEVGCGCCDVCTGQYDCDCCQDCTCGDEDGEVEQSNPETDVKVMNMMDFMNSISSQ
jgi:hypothetical protein